MAAILLAFVAAGCDDQGGSNDASTDGGRDGWANGGDGRDGAAGETGDAPGGVTDAAADVPPGDGRDAPAYADPRDVPAGLDDGGPSGVETGSDVVPRGPCVTHQDCAALAAPPGLPLCQGGAWSCAIPVAGQPGHCIRECASPGRTCTLDGNGCIACGSPAPPICAGAACPLFARPIRVERTTCPSAPTFEQRQCRGDWLIRDDGTLCSITELATGLPRYAIACPDCTTIVLQ